MFASNRNDKLDILDKLDRTIILRFTSGVQLMEMTDVKEQLTNCHFHVLLITTEDSKVSLELLDSKVR